MLPALYDNERSALARTAAALIVGAALVLPVLGQHTMDASAHAVPAGGRPPALTLPGPIVFPAYAVSRDPFVAQMAAPSLAVAPVAADASLGIVLPANAGAADMAPAIGARTSEATVRAIAIGDSSRALVDVGGDVRVYRVGDAIGTLQIAAITTAGVRLSDGTLLPFAERR